LSRKVTIKELAGTLGVSVPTIRKYQECGLLDVDGVNGRTNLFDEAAAVARIREINQLKERGYSLALIRERLAERPKRNDALDIGLDGPSFSAGRHVLLIVDNYREYHNFSRGFVMNGLRAGQAVILVVEPSRRAPFNNFLRAEGLDPAALAQTRQLTFAWYDDLQHFDAAAQVESFAKLVGDVVAAGWSQLRGLGDPEMDISAIEPGVLRDYECKVDALVESVPGIVICTWMAPRASANTLLELQRNHREVKFGDQVYLRA